MVNVRCVPVATLPQTRPGRFVSTWHGPADWIVYLSRKRSPASKIRSRFGMSTVPTSLMSRSKLVELPTATLLMKVLSTVTSMFFVSVGDGIGDGDGVGDAAG